MPKAVVTDEAFNWGDDRPPNVPWSDTVIYEAHVRGLTRLREDIQPNERGTFAGLADPAVIDHFRRLGITAIELQPVQMFLQDRLLLQKGLRNYWGYNTLAFFAPNRTICRTDPPTKSESPSGVCMPRGSRSFSTWCTTTPPRAANWGRRCRFGASIMPATIG